MKPWYPFSYLTAYILEFHKIRVLIIVYQEKNSTWFILYIKHTENWVAEVHKYSSLCGKSVKCVTFDMCNTVQQIVYESLWTY